MALIYIVEDDKNILEIETFAMKNSGYRVEGFETAKDFFKKIQVCQPDLVILDIMLPDEDGVSVVKKLRLQVDTRHVPVIMVTAKTTEIDKVKALDSGADDYVTKPFGVMELISRVKALLRRSMGLGEHEMLILDEITLEPDKRICSISGEEIELTYKEYELLYLLVQNVGIVLRRDVLMERIWGTDYVGESRTLDMHIKTLRQKLGEAGKHIKTVRNVGYRAE